VSDRWPEGADPRSSDATEESDEREIRTVYE
jgi:hypothetical protein